MTKLSQVLAIEQGRRTDTARKITDIYHLLKRPELGSGILGIYTSKFEDGDKLPDDGNPRVQVKSEEKLRQLAEAFTSLFDVTLTKDTANQRATADVTVDGTVLVSQAPVTFLLFLEKQLTDLRTEIRTLPTLSPDTEWNYDPSQGVYVSTPIETVRTKKVPKPIVGYEATEKHPAQVQWFQEDIIEGTWKRTRFSGAVSADRKTALLDRADQLLEAVKQAREQANTLDVEQHRIGESLFDWLLAP